MKSPERTHPEEPAEGEDAGADAPGDGRTPHTEEPAEGADRPDGTGGLDPAERVTGV